MPEWNRNHFAGDGDGAYGRGDGSAGCGVRGGLTIYDMCKALERGMEITELYVVKKSGGRSGVYERPGKRAKR